MFERRRMLTALEDAVLAPSIHNSQPWRFRVSADQVEVVLDAAVTPRLVDPDGRWALQSMGAAVASLELAVGARLGHGVEIDWLPDGDEPGPGPTAGGQAFDGRTVAVLRTVSAPPDEVAAAARLAAELPRRFTTRAPLRGGPPTAGELREIDTAAGAASPVRGAGASADLAERLLEITALSDARRVDDPAYLAEVEGWIDRRGRVGIPHEAGGAASVDGSFPGRDFSRTLSGRADWARDDAFESAPFLYLVLSPGGSPRESLLGGYGLQRALLAATAQGLGTGVLGQALEEHDTRARVDYLVSTALGRRVVVQQIVRLGHPDGELAHPATQRRPVKELLLH